MQRLSRLTKCAVAGALAGFAGLGIPLLVGGAAAAGAADASTPIAAPSGISDAVFVSTNDQTGNQILAYSRSSAGTLEFVHAYDTGGRGGALGGAVVDKLASQNSLLYDSAHRLLLVVNAGSNSITAFTVSGDRLSRPQVLPSHGAFPVSIAAYKNLVYVLDAGGKGRVVGYSVSEGILTWMPGSGRSLGLTAGAQPPYLNSPGQVGFTPDGDQLVVTTKDNGSDIDVFAVRADGWLSAHAVQNSSATAVPFGFVFDPHGRLIVAEASSGASAYAVDYDGTLTHLNSVADNQTAPCWITAVGGYYYVANAGSATISAYTADANANLALVGTTGIVASTDPGAIDLAASSGGQFLYAETGGEGILDEFQIGTGGSLSEIGAIDGLGATGIEGIVAA
jgi:6-phosphogluconolactonase (cycloisomerase 2 family)